MSLIAKNINQIQQNINIACHKKNRLPTEITLLGVTKTVSPERIQEAMDAGLTFFGENRVQEAKEKIKISNKPLHWHFIGHLQTNKAKEAIELFEIIQSVDSMRLAEKLNQAAEETNKILPILLEVNIGQEITKHGFLEEEVLGISKKINQLSNIQIKGLMTVAPYSENPENVRPFFKKMKNLFCRLEKPEILSMGMSHDYRIAIEEGSTMIRLGQAIFGARS